MTRSVLLLALGGCAFEPLTRSDLQAGDSEERCPGDGICVSGDEPAVVNELGGLPAPACVQDNDCPMPTRCGPLGYCCDHRGPCLGTISSGSIGGHTCAVMPDATVRCWGDNAYGALGDATKEDSSDPVWVVDVDETPIGDVTAVSTGYGMTCALHTNGSVQCWGLQFGGELSDTPHAMKIYNEDGSELRDVETIDVARFACGLMADTTVRCWRHSGLVFGDDPIAEDARPLRDATRDPVVGVVKARAGNSHACLLMNDASVQCAGYNLEGHLGDGTTETRAFPAPVIDANDNPLTDAFDIGTSCQGGCAAFNDGTVSCWGHGVLHAETVRHQDGTTPLEDVVALYTGCEHHCARISSGELVCWGYNADGQLGDGTIEPRDSPVVVGSGAGVSLSGVHFATAGTYHTCALLRDGNVACWGKNDNFELGDGTRISRFRPVHVRGW